MSESTTTPLRETLRGFASFPAELPSFDTAAIASTPREQFLRWLDETAAAGQTAPHVMTLATADAAGIVSARSLILKDIDERGWQFATEPSSPKGHDLAVNPNAALTFWWPVLGRQVRVVGPVTRLSVEESAADWLARPSSDGAVDPDWALYAVDARSVEFWQASHDRRHVRLRYERDGDLWVVRTPPGKA